MLVSEEKGDSLEVIRAFNKCRQPMELGRLKAARSVTASLRCAPPRCRRERNIVHEVHSHQEHRPRCSFPWQWIEARWPGGDKRRESTRFSTSAGLLLLSPSHTSEVYSQVSSPLTLNKDLP